jgi:hypothetical protein
MSYKSGCEVAPSAEIMRRQLANADLDSKLFDDMPYKFFRHSFAPNFSSASQEHPFNSAAAEFARVVRGLLEGQTGRPLFFNGV